MTGMTTENTNLAANCTIGKAFSVDSKNEAKMAIPMAKNMKIMVMMRNVLILITSGLKDTLLKIA